MNEILTSKLVALDENTLKSIKIFCIGECGYWMYDRTGYNHCGQSTCPLFQFFGLEIDGFQSTYKHLFDD